VPTLAKTSVVTAKLLQHTTIRKKGKKKQTNKRYLKNTQLRRTRKPTNPYSSGNTERGVLPMFCCKGAKGYQGLQMSSRREKNEKKT
jgi:hypothetical protein